MLSSSSSSNSLGKLHGQETYVNTPTLFCLWFDAHALMRVMPAVCLEERVAFLSRLQVYVFLQLTWEIFLCK